MRNQNGFTLVELAIVLMIIGLLIGGVLRGQELLNNAKVSKVIQQVNSYNGAINTFMDAYAAMPGDLATADTRLPGCQTGNPNSCQKGNGNSIIGALDSIWIGGQQGVTTENTQFWKHLALSHLITWIQPNAVDPVWGKSHPAAPFPGGFTVITATSGGGAQKMYGNLMLRLHGCLSCANIEGAGGSSDGAPLSPSQAGRIDRKMDDGIPGTGDVQSSAQGNGTAVDACEVAYTSSETPQCIMSFVLRR